MEKLNPKILYPDEYNIHVGTPYTQIESRVCRSYEPVNGKTFAYKIYPSKVKDEGICYPFKYLDVVHYQIITNQARQAAIGRKVDLVRLGGQTYSWDVNPIDEVGRYTTPVTVSNFIEGPELYDEAKDGFFDRNEALKCILIFSKYLNSTIGTTGIELGFTNIKVNTKDGIFMITDLYCALAKLVQERMFDTLSTRTHRYTQLIKNIFLSKR